MIHAVSLSDFARRFTESRSLAEDYAATLRRRAAALEHFSGESAIGLILSEARINSFLASLEGVRSAWTLKGYRGDLLTLWYAAADEGFTPYPIARRIRRVRLPAMLVDCYVTAEARELLHYVKTLQGNYPNGVARSLYWSAAIPLAWDAGFRRGDVWLFRRDAVRPDRTLALIQHKTQQRVTVRLHESTIAALDAIGLKQPCAWMLTKSRFGRHFQEIVRGAGVNRGSFKWLRRASGSYVEAEQPGAGHKHLGNGAGVFERHYDAKLNGSLLPMPPEL